MTFRKKLKIAFLSEKAPTQKSIASVFKISIIEVKNIQEKYHKKLDYIQKIRAKFQQKKYTKKDKIRQLNPDFKFNDFSEFYFWYSIQPQRCAYCNINEFVLLDLYEKNILTSKRGTKRGRSLEIERKDSTSNDYSKENCIFACYFCNNHKSDIISKDDHLKYFAKPIYNYLTDKWKNI